VVVDNRPGADGIPAVDGREVCNCANIGGNAIHVFGSDIPPAVESSDASERQFGMAGFLRGWDIGGLGRTPITE
jgi:hypothetical protein